MYKATLGSLVHFQCYRYMDKLCVCKNALLQIPAIYLPNRNPLKKTQHYVGGTCLCLSYVQRKMKILLNAKLSKTLFMG